MYTQSKKQKLTEILPIRGRNLRIQFFPFRPKFMDYLIENADAEIMQKFHRCCKQLYQMAPYFIVDSIEGYYPVYRFENEKYDECLEFLDKSRELRLPVNYKDKFRSFLSKIDKIWVTKKVKFNDCELSGILNKIVRCTAHEVLVSLIKLSYDNFKVLTESGNVDIFTFSLNDVVEFDPWEFSVEDILSHVPNVSSLFIEGCRVTPETMVKLNEIPWKKKIKVLKIMEIEGDLDVELFYKFAKVSCSRHTFDFLLFFNFFKLKSGRRQDFKQILPFLRGICAHNAPPSSIVFRLAPHPHCIGAHHSVLCTVPGANFVKFRCSMRCAVLHFNNSF